jgi:ATP-binding cassette subfamily B protein
VLIGLAVDVLVKQQTAWLSRLGFSTVPQQLTLLAVLSFVVWSLESLFEYLYGLQWRGLAQLLQHDLRRNAYAHLQRCDLSFFEARSSGRLMAVLNDDINQLERFLDNGANDILQLLTTLVAVGAAMLLLSPGLALLAMLPIPVILLCSLRFQARLGPRYSLVRERAGDINSLLANNIGGILTIKSYSAESWEDQRLEKESEAYNRSNKAAIRISAAFIPLIRFAILFAFIAVLVVGGLQAWRGTIAVGSFSFLLFILQRLLWPLTGLGRTLDDYQRAMASTQRVCQLLDEPIKIQSGAISLSSRQVRGALSLEQVHFAYPGRSPVLDGLSLEIAPGETLGLVGSTGSGKSTLVKLLLRLYDPDSGVLRLDGSDLRDLDLNELRSAIGLVSQEPFLFHGSVAENIRYGSFSASDSAVAEAARLAEAEEFITGLPQGYATVVGERGTRLSGGQRQRVALARAILKDPPILILDEATASVDNETEAAIQRSLERITADRTTLVVAHRLSTVRHAHRIVVMEQGRLVEQGDHSSLLRSGGSYARLWRVQAGLRRSDTLLE